MAYPEQHYPHQQPPGRSNGLIAVTAALATALAVLVVSSVYLFFSKGNVADDLEATQRSLAAAKAVTVTQISTETESVTQTARAVTVTETATVTATAGRPASTAAASVEPAEPAPRADVTYVDGSGYPRSQIGAKGPYNSAQICANAALAAARAGQTVLQSDPGFACYNVTRPTNHQPTAGWYYDVLAG